MATPLDPYGYSAAIHLCSRRDAHVPEGVQKICHVPEGMQKICHVPEGVQRIHVLRPHTTCVLGCGKPSVHRGM